MRVELRKIDVDTLNANKIGGSVERGEEENMRERKCSLKARVSYLRANETLIVAASYPLSFFSHIALVL